MRYHGPNLGGPTIITRDRTLCFLSVALLCLPACTEPERRPNVVIITVDTLRADALGVYGNPGGHSPHIDAFAADAIVFENAVTAIGTTFPSHATMFTGLYPKHHGVRENADALDESFTTLAEVLSAEGYETAAFVSWRSMLSRGGLHQGIATSDLEGSRPSYRPRRGEEVNEAAIPWLESREDGPFFVWLHYFETHSPYRLTPFAREQLAGYRGSLAEGVTTQMLYSLGREVPWTPEEARALRILYDGEVREADRLVGEVLDALQRRGLISETLVVITSDHGQALGENGQVGHGFLLLQPVLQVPLVALIPDLAPRRISTRVSLTDLTPFVLDQLELSVPPGLDGRSLPLSGDSLPSRVCFAESRGIKDRGKNRKASADPKRRALRLSAGLERDFGSVAVFDGDTKGVWSSNGFRVYDLATDPGERFPKTPDPEDSQLAALRDRAASYLDSEEIEHSREILEAVREELEALGYLR